MLILQEAQTEGIPRRENCWMHNDELGNFCNEAALALAP